MPTPNIPRAKREGLPVDFERLEAEGDAWLTPEDRYALKTYGVCAQAQPGVFMVRVRVPGGRMTPTQAHGLADLADIHGESWIHFTTRQNIEIHHVPARSVPAVLGAVESLGLTNRSACGHTLRNVMACPDAGVGLDEPFDCGPDAYAVSSAIIEKSGELNTVLPSRINISFGGCPTCAEHARLNDAGFESTVVEGEPGYRLWAGGSLGTTPFLAVLLAEFVPRPDVVAAALALTETFVELGDLDTPKKGRMKFVLESLGEATFRETWQERFARLRETTSFEPEPVPLAAERDLAEILTFRPLGGWSPAIRPQRTPGLALVTVNVTLGDVSGDELRVLADLTRLGDGYLWATRNQNVQYRDVPVAQVAALRAEVATLGLGLEGADSAVDVRACTGSAVCALAITESPAAGRRLGASSLLARNGSLRVHVSGCPNSCAQHQAADIGFAGAKVRISGRTRLGYTVFLGADLAESRVAEPIGRVADEHVETVVSGVIGTWETLRRPRERLVDTLDRVGRDAFAAHIAAIASGFEAGPEPAVPATSAVAVRSPVNAA